MKATHDQTKQRSSRSKPSRESGRLATPIVTTQFGTTLTRILCIEYVIPDGSWIVNLFETL